jgi:curved DNA-binding protein
MNYYNILGIDKSASAEDIKKAYRRLASQHHPDKGGDTSTFQKVEEAYRILSDPQKRQEYDNPAPQMGGFSFNFGSDMFNMPPGMDGDIFSHIFGQRAGNPFTHQRNHKQLFRTQVTITLEDAYFGKTQMLKIQTPTDSKIINIDIPLGVSENSQLKYDNILDNAILVVEFKILPNLKFERRQHDLYCNQSISVLDLITGTTIKIKTISGKDFDVTVPPKTQPNMQLKVSGQGMPVQNSGFYGDQFVCLKPFIPDTIDDEITQSILRSKNK